MIRKMREEELIVYIYLKSSDKYRKYLNLTSYFYTQKKEQSPDILTQQISVDSDCANDGCVALFEHLGCEFAKAVIDRCAGRIRKCSVSTSQETVYFFVIYIILESKIPTSHSVSSSTEEYHYLISFFGKHHLMHKLRRTRKIPDMLHSMAVTRQHDRNFILHTILQDLPVVCSCITTISIWRKRSSLISKITPFSLAPTARVS